MKRVLSGIQPSGQLHLGNYFGMMSRMIQYQEKNELLAFIVNYHALTTIQDGKILKENTGTFSIISVTKNYIHLKTFDDKDVLIDELKIKI